MIIGPRYEIENFSRVGDDYRRYSYLRQINGRLYRFTRITLDRRVELFANHNGGVTVHHLVGKVR